jgi:hypothetical protein
MAKPKPKNEKKENGVRVEKSLDEIMGALLKVPPQPIKRKTK